MRRLLHCILAIAMALAVLAALGGCASQDTKEYEQPWMDPDLSREELAEVLAKYTFDWDDFKDKPASWWKSREARILADELVALQQDDGGWSKPAAGEDDDKWTNSTFDNNFTWGQIRYLAQCYTAGGEEEYRTASERGIDFVLASQYDNGGWPQIVDSEGTYSACITFNDSVMTEATRLMRDVSEKSADAGFAWVDDERAQRAGVSFTKGLDCILDLQTSIDGRLTAWCQQYDRETLEPAPARAYEPAAVSTKESAYVVGFLKELDSDDPRIKASIDAATSWFSDIAIHGKRYVWDGDDMVLVDAPDDVLLWARFYDLETGQPIFSDRDGSILDDVTKVSKERRRGYEWYGSYPAYVL